MTFTPVGEFHAHAMETGLSFAWARLFYYGPGDDPTRCERRRAASSERTGTLPACPAIRYYMDVRDVGAALARLVTSEVSGPVKIATAQAVSIADIAMPRLASRPDLPQLGALPDRLTELPQIVADLTCPRRREGPAPGSA
jgi:nucleoside-diphosphate-sugar epimerase